MIQPGVYRCSRMQKRTMAQVKAIYYLPLRDKDGSDLAEYVEEVKMELFVLFAGWTFLGYVKGAFQMADGSHSLDESAAYMLVLEWKSNEKWISDSFVERM